MYAYIIGLAEDPDALTIETKRGGDIAIDGDVITSFDEEGPLVDGTAAGYVSREQTRPVVGNDAITTTTEETSDHVAVDYLADCGAGYVALYDHGTIETVATWLRDEIMPHAEVPDDDQQTLDGGGA